MGMKKYKFISANEYCVRVFDGTHDSPKPCEKGYKLLTSKNILAGELDKTSAYYISENDYNDINQRSKVQQYDILFSMIGSVGNVCFVKDSNIDFAIKNMGVFSCENKEKALYLYYYLQSPFAKKMIDSYLNGAVQKFLGLERLRNFPILEYSTDKQKIAAILSSLDDKIALNKKINAKLEAMAKRLYDYWFVQFDFPNGDGKPYKTSDGKMVWNEVLKREIPEGWEVKSIFEASDVLYGYPYATEPFDEDNLELSKKPYKVVRIRDIQNNSFSAKTTEVVDEKYKTNQNDLLVGMDGYFHMNFWFSNNDYINQRIVRFRKTLISTLILNFQIKPFIKFKETMAKGSTVGHLSDKDLKQLFIAIPNDNSISDRFDSILNMITKNNSEIQKLTELRDRLLPLLMNGQVEVEE